MANRPLDEKLAAEAVERVEAKLREGFRPPSLPGSGPAALTEAAEQAVRDGFVASVNAFKSRLNVAKDRDQLEPDWGLYRPARYTQPVPLAVVQPAVQHVAMPPSGPGERVLVIGDLHQDPRHPDRLPILTWIARHASEQRYDRIVQVGDWSSWDSVNQHDKNDTQKAKFKPAIKDDFDNLTASLQAWRAGMAPDYRPKQDVLLGNHENRLERFENANPEAWQTFTRQRDELFAQFGWRTRPYGEVFYVQGVGFTHHPVNGAGRAYGGKTGPQRAANESTVSMFSGHTHRLQLHSSPKIGPVDSVCMIEVGCAMLWGEVESYAAHSLTGWWQGVVGARVQGGVVTDLNAISMLTLQDRYGREAA